MYLGGRVRQNASNIRYAGMSHRKQIDSKAFENKADSSTDTHRVHNLFIPLLLSDSQRVKDLPLYVVADSNFEKILM